MKITGKELAEKLRALVDEDVPNTWEECARDLAEYMDYQLATERPEPGLYLYGGEAVLIDPQHDWYLFMPSEGTFVYMSDGDHNKLTPARVISEQELHDLNTKADNQTRDIQDLSQVLDIWKAKVAYAEARVSELRAELAGANETLSEMMPAEPVELTFKQADEIWQDASGKAIAPIAVRMAMNTAIAKHGHGRVKVKRDEVYRAISARTLYRPGHWDSATDAVMNLLGGDDHGE